MNSNINFRMKLCVISVLFFFSPTFAAETTVTKYFDGRDAAMALNYDTELYMGGMIHSGGGYNPSSAATRAQATLDGWPNIIADCELNDIPVSFNICGYEAVFGDTGINEVNEIDVYHSWHSDSHWATNTWYSDIPTNGGNYLDIGNLSGYTRSYDLIYGGLLTEQSMNSDVPFEISYHNFGHESLSNISETTMDATFRLGVEYHKRIGSKLTAECPPWNNNPQSSKYYIYVDNGIYVFNRMNGSMGDPYEVIENLWIVPRNGAFNAGTDLTTSIDSAITNGYVLAPYSHPEDGFNGSSRTGFQTSLAYAKTKVNSGQLWATTLSEIGRYWEAKSDVSTTTEILGGKTTVSIDLVDYDAARFGIPYLTFISPMPDGSPHAKITVNYPTTQILNSDSDTVRVVDANAIYTVYLDPASTTTVEIDGAATAYTGGVDINKPILSIDSTAPADPNSGAMVTITATAVSTDDIYTVNLIYQNGSKARDSRVMTYNPSGYWETQVGPFAEGDSVSYYVSVTDNSGRREVSADKNFSVALGPDTTLPQWQNQGQNSSTPPAGSSVHLYADGMDDRALRYATLATDETGSWEKKTAAYGSPMSLGDLEGTWVVSDFTWSNPSISWGTTVSWRIYYEDAAGNETATDIMSFTLQEPDLEAPNYLDPSHSSELIDAPTELSLKWTDNVALDEYIFSFDDGSGTFVDDAPVKFTPIDGWWDSDWQYRKAIDIDNTLGSQALTNHAVQISIDTAAAIAAGKMNPYGGDIRFIDPDGSSELDFWIESGLNTSNTRIWIEIPGIDAGFVETVYMYYGSSNHRVSQSNGQDTFAVFDDFGGRGWEEFKYINNPVMGPGSSAGGSGVFSSVMRESETLWRMYASYDSDNRDIGLSTSSDGINWTHQGVVLGKGTTGEWDSSNIWCPAAWKEGSTYYLLYAATGPGGIAMGLATSTDGVAFTKYAGNPVFEDPDWAAGDTEGPCFSALKENGEYYVMYNTLGGHRQSSIVSSSDLMTWTRVYDYPRFAGGASTADWNYNTFCGNVFKYDDLFYLIIPGQDSSRDYAKFGMYVSSSPTFPEDDTEFKGIVMIGNSSGWEGNDMDTPWVVQFDDTMHMYYSACGSCWSQTGLTIINDIPLALTQAYPPGNYIATERSNSASLQIMPPVGWEKSITGYEEVGGQNFEITLAPAVTGRAVVMQDANDIVPLELYKDIDSLSSGSVSAWMQTDTATGEYNMELYGDSQSVTALSVGFDSGGVFHYWNGSHVDTGISFAVDTWYRIQIDFDVTTNKYAFAVYDTSPVELLKVEDVDFGSSVTTGIDSIHFYTSASFNGHAYLDDIRVIALPDLEPVVSISSELTPDLTESFSTVTKTLTSDVGATIRWKVTASDTSGNTTTSDIYSFTTTEPDLPTWWDTNWTYRIPVTIDTAAYARTNEPIEHAISFTQLFDELGQSGLTLDINSVRVAEHDPNGVVIGEANSQFDEDAGFDAATNATGTVVWIMDGTTPASTTRYYYIYFDSVDKAKSAPAYATDLDWNDTTKAISNTTLRATIGSAGGRSGLSSFQYNGTEYLTNNGMVYIDGSPSTYEVPIDGPVKKTVKLTATANGSIDVTVYDLAEFMRLQGHITGSSWSFTPFPYLWALNTGACTNTLRYFDAGYVQTEAVSTEGWLDHAPEEGWACYDGSGTNKGFCLVTDSSTLSISNNFWRHTSTGRQLMLPGFNPNVGFPIYPVSWIVLTETYQDGQDFWNKLGSPVILSQGTAEEQAVPTTHNLTVSAGSNGAVDPNGLVIVDQGASQLFTAISDVGYEVDAWLVDDSPVQSGGLEYTLSNISVDHTVLVTFKPLIFAVTASTGSNGLISPNGVVNADYKSDQLFTAMPDIHYDVDIWYVDGNPVQTGGLEYTLSDIQTNHTVSVTFKQVPLNILFIGNSFTGHGPIPLVVRSIAVSAGWEAPNVTNHSSDAQDLDFYSADPNTLALIDQGGWDYVVLQEYSTLPTDNAGYPEGFKTAATSLYDSVKASNPQAQVVLYETWARHEDHEIYPITFTDPNQMYLQLQTHYHDCADNYIPSHSTALRKTDVSVSPVGEAWHANTLDQNLMLHNVDLYHANSRGQYLSSLVLYSMIYGRMVAGLSPQLGVSDADTIYLQSLCDSVTGQTIPQVGSEPNTLEVGETIYIDFGSYLSTTPGNWNNVSSTDGGINRAVTSSGTPTTVNILIPDRFSEFNANGTIVPDPVLNLPAEATKDTFYGNDIEVEPGGSVEPIAQLVISNLDPNLLYDLSFFASRIGVSDNRQTEYAVSGNGGLAHTLHLNPSNNTNTIVRGSNVRPTSTGDIVIDIQKGPQNDNVSGFYYLGTLTIKAKELLYLVAASAGPNGSINPNGGVSISPGDSQLFTAASDADYDVNQWSVDGSLMQTGGTEFTLSDVAADHTVSVTFRHIADLQVDGVINVNDLQILCDNWLTAVSPDIDIHDDGKMDLLDFSILAKHWLDDGIPSIIVP